MAKVNKVPVHPNGWKFKGSSGRYLVWHAGSNNYQIERDGEFIDQADQFGIAFGKAMRLSALDAYYTDRNNSGQAALAT